MKAFLFAIVSFINAFRPANWSIKKVEVFVCKKRTQVIDYVYNGKIYKFVGSTLPCSIRKGFFLPIKKAFWNGVDVTERIRLFAGPRHDFYGSIPDLAAIFHNVTSVVWLPKISYEISNGLSLKISWEREVIVEPIDGTLEVTNVLDQTSVFGAKKNLISPKLATE